MSKIRLLQCYEVGYYEMHWINPCAKYIEIVLDFVCS